MIPKVIAFLDVCIVSALCEREKENICTFFMFQENLYEQFLIRRCHEMFADNALVIQCARLPVESRDKRTFEKSLKRDGFALHIWPNEVVL